MREQHWWEGGDLHSPAGQVTIDNHIMVVILILIVMLMIVLFILTVLFILIINDVVCQGLIHLCGDSQYAPSMARDFHWVTFALVVIIITIVIFVIISILIVIVIDVFDHDPKVMLTHSSPFSLAANRSPMPSASKSLDQRSRR